MQVSRENLNWPYMFFRKGFTVLEILEKPPKCNVSVMTLPEVRLVVTLRPRAR